MYQRVVATLAVFLITGCSGKRILETDPPSDTMSFSCSVPESVMTELASIVFPYLLQCGLKGESIYDIGCGFYVKRAEKYYRMYIESVVDCDVFPLYASGRVAEGPEYCKACVHDDVLIQNMSNNELKKYITNKLTSKNIELDDIFIYECKCWIRLEGGAIMDGEVYIAYCRNGHVVSVRIEKIM